MASYQHPFLANVDELRQFGAEGNFDPEQLAQQRQRASSQQVNELGADLLGNLSGLLAGRNMPPAINMMQQKGYNMQDPNLAAYQPFDPLQLQQKLLDSQHFAPAVKGLNPESHAVSEEAFNQLEQATPEMVEALKGIRGGGIYEGIPDNFYTKRVRIYLQRKREHDMYSFI